MRYNDGLRFILKKEIGTRLRSSKPWSGTRATSELAYTHKLLTSTEMMTFIPQQIIESKVTRMFHQSFNTN